MLLRSRLCRDRDEVGATHTSDIAGGSFRANQLIPERIKRDRPHCKMHTIGISFKETADILDSWGKNGVRGRFA